MSIEPQRAPVTPRVLSDDGSNVPLENEILPLLHTHTGGFIAVLGGAGSGRTTALRHLACMISEDSKTLLLDNEIAIVLQNEPGVVIYTASRPFDELNHIATFRLAPWTQDDWIEYLLANHKERCASVMERVNAADGAKLLGGIPELWRVVLDEFAADETLTRFGDALLNFLRKHLDAAQMALAQKGCLAKLLMARETVERTQRAVKGTLAPVGVDTEDWTRLEVSDVGEIAWSLLRHEPVQTLLAREKILSDLHADEKCGYLVFRLPRTFVRMLAAGIKDSPALLERLRKIALKPNSQAMAGSILHAAGAGWTPDGKTGWNLYAKKLDLSDGYFERAQWPGIELPNLECRHADFSHADLNGAILDRADLNNATFRRAKFRKASLKQAHAVGANFAQADFSGIDAFGMTFMMANLNGACFDDAELGNTTFYMAQLSGARFCRANLSSAQFDRAKMEGADFSQANLNQARIAGQKLREATFTGASFEHADLRGCDLEFMELPGAIFDGVNLRKALLTGSFIPCGKFHGADLRDTGLAEIEWERADLSNADLRGCSFHMGSSRSGRVNSDIACEGSRTGFYTDEYYEQFFKAPEQIRKANLRGADLRGANILGVDFYLVDLREARFEPKFEHHLRRSGAILETRE